MKRLNKAEIDLICGGKSEDRGFWYNVGAFFAAQANANDSINETYGNTNRNHI